MDRRRTDVTRNYDVITVGGGLAGAALATALARTGTRVLVLEREQQFRDRVRGEWLAPWGVEEAQRLGLGEAFEAAGAHILPALAGRAGKPRVDATPLGEVARTFSHPRLQEELLRQAERSGATVLRGARVTAVDRDASAVTYDHDGAAQVSTARLIVGADGRSSLVRRALAQPVHTYRSGRLLAGVRLQNVAGDASAGYFLLDDERSGVASLFPQGGGLARAYVFAQGDERDSYAGPEGFARFIETAIEMGIPSEVLAGARQDGPLAAFAADESWVEQPAADGIALIGDAAGISDATWGMGIALAFRDARLLADALAAGDDWSRATAAYATEHDRGFATIQTGERWMSELALTPGPEARKRRLRAMRRWVAEPDRALDLPGVGPQANVSAEARERFFAEDRTRRSTAHRARVGSSREGVMSAESSTETVEQAREREQQYRAVGQAFLDAVGSRDFEALEALIHPRARMRSLQWDGHLDYVGREDIVDVFRGWYGDLDEHEVISTALSIVGERLHVGYHYRVLRPEHEGHEEVEQHVYFQVRNGRVLSLDLICSGYRPASAIVEQASAATVAA
jgi:2-polyprenyl-6-methoxyphenol hydroxylase-like FAD-dependent oxidoreductase